eukprot:6510170-Prymnesium_polylepis.1
MAPRKSAAALVMPSYQSCGRTAAGCSRPAAGRGTRLMAECPTACRTGSRTAGRGGPRRCGLRSACQ